MTAPFPTQSFLRIPFVGAGRDRSGCDCWGLYRLIVGELAGVWLPDYPDAGTLMAASRELTAQRAVGGWRRVDGAETRLDLVLMSGVVGAGRTAHRAPAHVGCVIAPGLMIDTQEGVGVAVRFYDDIAGGRCHPTVKGRVLGVYRCPVLEGIAT